MTHESHPVIRLRRDKVMWNSDDDEVVVLDISTSRYFALNDTGAALWELLAEGASSVQLKAALVERHGAAEDAAARDVESFLDDLEKRDLVESD